MFFERIDTKDEIRWINFAQIARVTVAREADDTEVMVVMFANGCNNTTLRLQASHPEERKAMERMKLRLAGLAESSPC